MTEEQREHYMRAVEGLVNAGGQLNELDANWLRMRQIISGYLKWSDEHGDHTLHFKQNPKLDGLEQLIDEMGDSKIVVCYDYTETGKIITERVKSMGLDYEWYYGGTKDKSGSRRRFMEDPKCKVFVMNSEAGGTGNDGLQKVARYMAFYETPTPPITRKQTIKRIHRPGQTQRSFVYDLVMRKSLDKGILEAIAENINVYEKVVNGQAKKNLLLGL
jgi:SNF2 family DNA or RNA helicase